MFHLELRQFPHLARAFNLNRDELETRVLKPWVEGSAVELDERRFSPERARIVIYEGRALEGDEIGMGRGWGNVTRTGEEVTERLLAEIRASAQRPPVLAALKERLLEWCAEGSLGLWQVVDCAADVEPTGLASARLALAEQAVWELLHEGQVRLLRVGAPVEDADWQPVLLSWASWRDEDVLVEAAAS